MMTSKAALGGRLRHGRAHRATAAANLKNARPIYVNAVATVSDNVRITDDVIDVTEVIGDCRDRLRRWCERNGIQMMTLAGRTMRKEFGSDNPFGDHMLVGMIVEMRGAVPAMPATAEGWRLQIATGNQIEAAGLMYTPTGLQRRQRGRA